MTTLADDLLKTRSISELRVLSEQLKKDAESKQNDLQLMVGSQYHDFIQSADKISEMKKYTGQITEQLNHFWDHNIQVMQNVQLLIDKKSSLGFLNSKKDQSYLPGTIFSITSNYIWNDLNTCDIYNATKKLILAEYFLYLNDSYRFLSSNSIEILKSIKVPSHITSTLKYSHLLKRTVIDDAKAFCLINETIEQNNLLINEKAKSLVSYLFLVNDKCAFESKDILFLFETYLSCAEIKIKEVFNLKGQTLDASIISTVSTLQSIIVELYVLFFHSFDYHSSTRNKTFRLPGLIQVYLFQMFDEINEAITESYDHSFPSSFDPTFPTDLIKSLFKLSRSWLNEQLKYVMESCSTLLASLSNAIQVAQLQQKIYKNSVRTNLEGYPINFNSATCKSVGNIASYDILWSYASDYLLSSQIEKSSSSKPTQDEKHALPSYLWSTVYRVSFLHQVERLLQKACENILSEIYLILEDSFLLLGLKLELSTNPLNPKISYTNNSLKYTFNSAKLYSIAERVRLFFDSSLARLLDDVITPVHKSELVILEDEKVSFSSDPGLSGQALRVALKSNCSKLVGQFLSSLRRVSEVCRDLMLSKGLISWEKPIFPLQPKGSSGNLSELYEVYFHSPSYRLTDASTEAVTIESYQRYLYGFLLLGRLAWIMKFRSVATKNALLEELTTSSQSNSQINKTKVRSHAHTFTTIISEEQFRSAFEIADANGDGIIDLNETIEALQALYVDDQSLQCLSIDVNDSTPPGSSINQSFAFPALINNSNLMTSVATLSYDEFALIFGSNLLSSQALSPLQRYHNALDYIIMLNHFAWILIVVQSHVKHFSTEIIDELDLIQLKNPYASLLSSQASFKSSWSPKSIDLDTVSNLEDDIGVKKETLLLPTKSSRSLLNLYHELMGIYSQYLVSIDTMQGFCLDNTISSETFSIDNSNENRLSSSTKFLIEKNGQGFKGSSSEEMILSNSMLNLLNELLHERIADQYYRLLQGQLLNNELKSQIIQLYKQERLDDIFTQIYMDVLVSIQVANISNSSIFDKLNSIYEGLLELFQNQMDPILLELTSSTMKKLALKCTEENSLLLFPKSIDYSSKSPSQLTGSSEQPLATLFPKTTSNQPSIRLTLLPLALSTVSNYQNQNSSNSQQSYSAAPSTPIDIKKSIASTPVANNTSSMMKWW